jgi:hypothetical protein
MLKKIQKIVFIPKILSLFLIIFSFHNLFGQEDMLQKDSDSVICEPDDEDCKEDDQKQPARTIQDTEDAIETA